MNNTSMTLDQAKSKVLDMDNKTLENIFLACQPFLLKVSGFS
jgi:hypothetical protein